MEKHAHFLVVRTAREMAEALYEETIRDNAQFAVFKALNKGLTRKQMRARFVGAAAVRLLPEARATLAKMLEGNLDERLKNEIHDALVKDAALVRGRAVRPIQLH